MLPKYVGDKIHEPSRIRIKDSLLRWLRLIISDQKSRNLFFFLLLNLSFAFVELFYGVWTNSLGLISDSFHMFFDCTALVAGLVASIIAKWKSNDKFTYGYVRAEVLAGFINGLFLIFIAFFIFSEAMERVFEPPEIHHERLLVISVLGFIVNLIGIFVFQHGGDLHHGHSHGGGGSGGGGHDSCGSVPHHGHSHDNNNDFIQSHAHSHENHGHSHGGSNATNQILQGVFLHILADTLGSVGVIISSLLIRFFDWHIADPICSIIIALLISLSVIPLLRDSGGILMQRQPKQLDAVLPDVYKRLAQIDGVMGVQNPHFWTLCSDKFVGAVQLEARVTSDLRYIMKSAKSILAQFGLDDVYIQIDYL